MSTIEIAGRKIGHHHPVFIVAELSGNHHKSFDTAVELIHAAREAGADAVKTQCFCPGSMTLHSDTEPFRIVWQGKETTLWDLYSETAMPMEWHPRLMELAESLGLVYFASVFDKAGVDYMDSLGVPALKVASFELTDLPLIRYAASKGKPIIFSTGMATKPEIADAVLAAGGYDSREDVQLAALHCVSAYPAGPKDANLRTLHNLVPEWAGPAGDIVIGLSDHTRSNAVVSAAVALGARIIERHLKLDEEDKGPDASFSDTPDEFADMVAHVRNVEAALGVVRYGPTDAEREMVKYRRSLWVVRDVPRGGTFTTDNLASLRPATGLHPKHLDAVLGKRAARDCRAGEALSWEMVE